MLRFSKSFREVGAFLIISVCSLLPTVNASDNKVVDWNISKGNAVETLKILAQQGRLEIMYSDAAVAGIETNPLMGPHSITEAFDILLKGTDLRVMQTENKKIYAIKLIEMQDESDFQTNLQNEMTQRVYQSEVSPLSLKTVLRKFLGGILGNDLKNADDDTFELSPFIVQTSDNDIGYYSENTLAGSRLNSKVSDLAASISVIGRQQLEDTASVDLNDMFLYEANTEGSYNYSDYEIDKDGAIRDVASGVSNGTSATGPYSANRIRGIAQAETARNYHSSISRIPFDAYNTSTFEINRGPNSILFGLGNAAGIVNQSLANALIDDNSAELQIRAGSWGSFRTSLRANKTVWDHRLAVLVAGVHDEKGFRRQPSYDRTNRYYFNLNFEPSSGTSMHLFYERYENSNRRPNTMTPRDLVTPWREGGSPAWNPLDQTVSTYGVVSGPFNSDDELPAALWGESNRPLFYYEKGELQLFTQRRLSSDPDVIDGGSIYRTVVSGYGQPGPLWVAKGVTDRSLYDWKKINILSGNIGKDEASTWGLEFDREIVHGLFLNLGWFRESFVSDNSYYIAQQTGATIQVDPNLYLLDGNLNPFFGKPFIEVREPDDFHQWEDNRNFRAALAYAYDFGDLSEKLSWLGRLNLMLLCSNRKAEEGVLRLRQMVSSSNSWVNPEDLSQGAGGAIYRRFYLGDRDGNVDYDPGIVLNGERSYSLYRAVPAAGTTPSSPIANWSWTEETVDTTVGLHPVSGAEQREITSQSVVMQNYLFNERIVTTVGWRKDVHKARASKALDISSETGLPERDDVGAEWYATQRVSSQTHSLGVVGRVNNWLSVHFNESDNFQPATVKFNLLDGSVVPLPTGHGRDFGLSFDFFGGRFFARANCFESEQKNTRVYSQLWRLGYFDAEAFQDWAELAASYEGLSGTDAENRIAQILQFPAGFESYWNRTSSTSDVIARGLELNLVYNPTRNWTLKFNLARQQTTYRDIFPEYDTWKQARLAVWKSAHSDALPPGYQDFWSYNNLTAPDAISHIGIIGGEDTATPESWFYTNVDALVTLSKKLEDKVSSGQREWRWNLISNYSFGDGVLKNWSLGTGIRWEDQAIIGYKGGKADWDGVVRQLDSDQPVYDDAQIHVDFWCSYRLKMFQDKVGLKLQLNIRDVLENGGLLPVGVNPDGSASTFRIVDPRQFFLTATFDF